MPVRTAAQSFRHHYGVTLTIRGVPQPIISQLMGHADPRTTSIYTTVASVQMIGALDDAELLWTKGLARMTTGVDLSSSSCDSPVLGGEVRVAAAGCRKCCDADGSIEVGIPRTGVCRLHATS